MKRVIIVGDVHGCIDELDRLLAKVAPRAGDRFAFLGDLVDRGPDSVGVIRRVRELLGRFPDSVCIAGNHEEKALRHREKGKLLPAWAPGATDDDWRFLDALPLIAKLDDLGVVLVHGGFFPAYFEKHGKLGDVPRDWRHDRDKRVDRLRRMLRIRTVSERGEMVALGEETASSVHWSSRYDGREGFCFFGHDPQLDPAVPLRAEHAMGLDTGCCFGGVLTAAIVTTDARDPEIVSVPGQRYAEPRHRHSE